MSGEAGRCPVAGHLHLHRVEGPGEVERSDEWHCGADAGHGGPTPREFERDLRVIGVSDQSSMGGWV
jgi:hypothetical protein